MSKVITNLKGNTGVPEKTNEIINRPDCKTSLRALEERTAAMERVPKEIQYDVSLCIDSRGEY